MVDSSLVHGVVSEGVIVVKVYILVLKIVGLLHNLNYSRFIDLSTSIIRSGIFIRSIEFILIIEIMIF
jgi:hypothetical protein